MSHMPTFANSSQPATVANDEATPIVICAPVYADSTTGVKRASASGSGTASVVGLVSSSPSIAAGAVGTIVGPGEYFSATTAQWDAVAGTSGGLAFNTVYYLSNTAGRLSTSAGSITAPVCVALSPTTVLITLAGGGGGGGGITNSAASNVIMKSDGTNAIASGLTDDGTAVTTTRNLAIGSSSPGTPMWLNKSTPTTTTQFYIQETDASHTGNTGVLNEAICLVLDQRATFDTTADAVSASANGLTILLSSTRVGGSKPLINDGLIIAVSGGDSNRAIHTTTGGGIVAFDDGGTVGPWTITGAFTTGGGVTSIAGTSGSAISLTGTGGNITTASGTVTAASVHSVGILKCDSEFRLDPGASGTQGYAYMVDAISGSNIHNLNVSSSGAGGKIIFQGNNIGTNSGTGGIEVWAGANGGVAKGGVTGAGRTWGTTLGIASSGMTISSGAVTPNTNVTGSVGDLYTWTGGGAGTTLWVKESGSATNTGWVSK